ncbi:MAG: hypothetical protein RIS70_3502 [Planctomycetota bacterium]
MSHRRSKQKRRLLCERLEARMVLSGVTGTDFSFDPVTEEGTFHALIVAGDPNGNPSDSPAARVDSNTDNTPFDGVGSITIAANRGNYICTGTPIDATHVVTAGHCVDLNSDGKSDRKDGINSITFNVNFGGNYSSRILASSWVTHPDFTGFNRPSINDDIAVLTLSQPIPDVVPKYQLFTGELFGQTITMVGYGQSGDGISGYTVGASYTVKRSGQNVVDAFYAQDDGGRSAANEVFRFDFDRANGTNGPLGGPSLGNNIETTLGGGDSGGPSFINNGTAWLLAGVNTFSQSTSTASAPKFGSLGGGMSIPAYANWIGQVSGGGAIVPASGDTSTGNGKNGTANVEVIRGQVDEPIFVNSDLISSPRQTRTTTDLSAPRQSHTGSHNALAGGTANVIQVSSYRFVDDFEPMANRTTRKRTAGDESIDNKSSSLDADHLDAVDSIYSRW